MPGFDVVTLPPAQYPPIALAARVAGDVVLNIHLHPDGTLDSVDVISGPPMLHQAALESTHQTQFACAHCQASVNTFQITFRFTLGPTLDCAITRSPDYPSVTRSGNIITIADQPFGTCDPAISTDQIRTRSFKCMYLWKCGWRVIAPH